MSTKSEGFANESKVRREFREKKLEVYQNGRLFFDLHIDFD